MILIKDLDKADVFVALYEAAKRPSKVPSDPPPKALSVGFAQSILQSRNGKIDILNGRKLMIDLSGDQFDETGYERVNGMGLAWKVVKTLRQ